MIDLTKTYRTRDGKLVELFTLDAKGRYPVVGQIQIDGEWSVESWTAEGRYNAAVEKHDYNLVEVRPATERWVNINDEGGVSNYVSRSAADMHSFGRIALIHIQISDGSTVTAEVITND